MKTMQLQKFIRSKVNINEYDLKKILVEFKLQKVAKEKFVLKKGNVADAYFFVQSGGLRIYSADNDKQLTGWIALENEFFTELSSLKNQMPSHFYIQAIEDTVLLTIKHKDMERMYETFPIWQKFGRQLWEDAFLKVIDGLLSFQTMSAEERYLTTMKHSDLLQRVPLKDLASFLGITQTSLSRLRKKIK